jgi:hypothetical protein
LNHPVLYYVTTVVYAAVIDLNVATQHMTVVNAVTFIYSPHTRLVSADNFSHQQAILQQYKRYTEEKASPLYYYGAFGKWLCT